MSRIKKKTGISLSKDDVEFKSAPPGQYWRYKKTKRLPKEQEKRDKGGRVYEIYAPEVYPVTSAKSFLEETRVGDKSLLDILYEGGDIPWGKVTEDSWAIYMHSNFNKAVQLLEYWKPGKPFEKRDYGWGRIWAEPLTELKEPRLRIERELKRLRKEQKTYQTAHNIAVLPVYAATGGVAKPKSRNPAVNLSGQERGVILGVLRGIGYLRRREGLKLN